MAHRSYLNRVVGGGEASVKLTSPRLLFRRPALPIEATNGLEVTAQTGSPTQPLSAIPTVPRRRAPLLSTGPASANPHAPVGVDRASQAPEDQVPAGPRHSGLDEGAAATSESAYRQSRLAPVSPQSRGAERETEKGARPAASAYPPGPRGVAAEARDARHLQECPGLVPGAVATTGQGSIAAGPATNEPFAGSPARLLRPGEPTLPLRMATGHGSAESQQERSALAPVAGTRAVSPARDLHRVDQTRAAGSLAPPIRLEPPAVVPPTQRPELGERTAGVRIGSLEVRILPTPAEPAPAAPPRANPAAEARRAPVSQPAGPLSRGFRSFGLVQG
jgi:hypothetical protein